MTSLFKNWKVVLTTAYVVGYGATGSVAHAAETTNSINTYTRNYTFTCTINGVRYEDCDLKRPIYSRAPELCPERRLDFDYGKSCDFRIKTLRFNAVKLQHTYGEKGFKAGTPFIAAYDINDNGTVIGEAYNDRGERHAVSTEVGPHYSSNTYFSDLGKVGLTSSGHAISNNYIIAGTSQTSSGNRSHQGYVWNHQGGLGKAIGLNGNAGAATGVGISMYQRVFISGYDVWPMSKGGDGKVHSYVWTYQGPGYEYVEPMGAKGQSSRALDVNDSGQVVGYFVQNGINQAYIAINIQLEPLPDFGNFESQALDVNNNDNPMIVGFAKNRAGSRIPVMWQSNQINTLRLLPNTTAGRAIAISDAGDIVGESGGHAAVWRDGAVHDLNNLLDSPIRAALQSAVDMNRSGRILVKGSDGYYVLIPTSDE